MATETHPASLGHNRYVVLCVIGVARFPAVVAWTYVVVGRSAHRQSHGGQNRYQDHCYSSSHFNLLIDHDLWSLVSAYV
jgi:hypothetical protein